MAKNPKLALTVQFADMCWQKQFSKKVLKNVVQTALFSPAEITLRFVNAKEGKLLNHDFRGKDYATNVLTFAYGKTHDEYLQADIVLCTNVIEQEALSQHKSLADHLFHLIVHGVLHAQGYDHEEEKEAVEMETLEIKILAKLEVKNPYRKYKVGS